MSDISDGQLADKLYSSKSLSTLTDIPKKDELNTGISVIDTNFGFPSGYYVILGNPGTGKSWFALWLSRMFFRHNQKRSVYFTLEMPEPLVRKRILQAWSNLTKAEHEGGGDVSVALELLGQDAIIVDDFYAENQAQQTPETLTSWIEKYYEIGYRCFHFDHLHELFGANNNQTNQSVTEKWAKAFQQVCKQFPDIWLFVYAQPNGAAANKKVLRRTDIAGSKAITQKCDYVMSLNRNIELDEETGSVVIDQNRRNIILYLDKSRYTEEAHMGFKLRFGENGNFYVFEDHDV